MKLLEQAKWKRICLNGKPVYYSDEQKNRVLGIYAEHAFTLLTLEEKVEFLTNICINGMAKDFREILEWLRKNGIDEVWIKSMCYNSYIDSLATKRIIKLALLLSQKIHDNPVDNHDQDPS